jgi:hypothetical protein
MFSNLPLCTTTVASTKACISLSALHDLNVYSANYDPRLVHSHQVNMNPV